MANTNYSMDQFRYNGTTGSCMTSVEGAAGYLDWKIETETSPLYRDVYFKLNSGEFSKNSPYYFTFGIPRNSNYDFNIAIKLLKYDEDAMIYTEASTPYQFIKYVSSKRSANSGISNSLVVLYNQKVLSEGNYISEQHGRVAIQLWDISTDDDALNWQVPSDNYQNWQTEKTGQFIEVQNPVAGYKYYEKILYHNVTDDTYWMFASNNGYPKFLEVGDSDPFGTDEAGYDNILVGANDIVLNWTWDNASQSDISYHKCIFVPQDTGFDCVLLQLQRIVEDPDIISDVINEDTGQSISGRYINLDQPTGNMIEGNTPELVRNTFKLYQLTELNQAGANTNTLRSAGGKIVRFGIWGHPELLMSINGEEIQIGASGYYELNDFDVTSFAVVADGPEDKFVLDYQYVVSATE